MVVVEDDDSYVVSLTDEEDDEIEQISSQFSNLSSGPSDPSQQQSQYQKSVQDVSVITELSDISLEPDSAEAANNQPIPLLNCADQVTNLTDAQVHKTGTSIDQTSAASFDQEELDTQSTAPHCQSNPQQNPTKSSIGRGESYGHTMPTSNGDERVTALIQLLREEGYDIDPIDQAGDRNRTFSRGQRSRSHDVRNSSLRVLARPGYLGPYGDRSGVCSRSGGDGAGPSGVGGANHPGRHGDGHQGGAAGPLGPPGGVGAGAGPPGVVGAGPPGRGGAGPPGGGGAGQPWGGGAGPPGGGGAVPQGVGGAGPPGGGGQGGLGAVLGAGQFGPMLPPRLLPARDDFNRGNDRHVREVQALQVLLRTVVHLTYRETRHLLLGGHPQPAPQIPYPGIPYLSAFLNHAMLPSLISPDKYKSFFGVSPQDFYKFRDLHVLPAMQGHHSHAGTADSLTAVFFLKLRSDISYRILGLIYGSSGASTMLNWFHLVLDHVYQNSLLLIRSRNLGNPNNMRALLEELHQVTMHNSRFAATFMPILNEAARRNPLLVQNGPLKLVGGGWDSRHILIPHSICFDHQRRQFSSKVSGNAIVKTAMCGLDGKQKFHHTVSASISPANTDEGLCGFLMDLEATTGTSLLDHPYSEWKLSK